MLKRLLIGLTAALLAFPALAQIPGNPTVLINKTWAAMPSAATAGQMIRCSDCGAKGAVMVSDGTIWKPLNGQALLASRDAISANVANTETVVLQAAIPVGMWQTGFMIVVNNITFTKSGTTDTGTIKIRVGTTGTTADTQILTNNSLGAANRSWRGDGYMRLDSVTSVLPVGGNSGGFQPGTTNSALSAIALASSTATNAFFVSVTISASSTNDTVALALGDIWLVSKAN